MTPTPFKVSLPPEELDELRKRLRATRWPHVIGEDDWRYGAKQAWMQEMVRYWAHEWDWQAQAAEINRFDHFQVDLEGVPIHFIHMKGEGDHPTPLILTHGWPWTFWDLKNVIEPLARPSKFGGNASDAFDVVVPSLPGYGLSVPLTRSGIGVPEVASLWTKLMVEVLGYERFAAQGGDWGALITGHLGHAHGDRVSGVHISLPVIPGLDLFSISDDQFAPDEAWMVERRAEAAPTIQSHVAVHSRDPQTLAILAADSPAGTGAWLWERRRAWSDCNGDVESIFDRDHLCTTAALYWCNGSFTSAMRLYYEFFNKPWPVAHDRPRSIDVPTAFALFPKELIFLPRRIAEEKTNLQRWTIFERGGHFAAAEQPDALVGDVRAFFRDLR